MKETVACLTNADVSDFIYCCTSHLSDPGFARPAPSESSSRPSTPTTPTVSQAEIDKVKKEYEEKQAKKKEGGKEDEKEKEKSWLSTGVAGISSLASTATSLLSTTTPPATPPPPPSPQPTVFILHRTIFAMRVDAAKKKWQAKEAKDRLKTLSFPSVPGTLPALRKA